MYTVVSVIQIVVRFKDVHGVAFTAAIRQKKHDIASCNYDAANHRSAGPLQGAHKIYFCSAVHIKRILKKALHDSSVSATRLQNHKLLILCCDGNLKPPFHIQCSIVGSCCHLRPGPAQHVFCLHQTLELIPHSQQGLERE